MNKGITNAILAIAIAIMILPVCTQAQLMPHGIAGTVYMPDGATQAPAGTSFNVTDATSGDYIAGTTGAGPDSGGYSVTIDGDDGDTVIVKAWNTTHCGEVTVTLAGDMTGIDVVIDMPSGADTTPSASVSDLDEIDKGATWIEWGWTNPSDSDFNHTEVHVNGVKADVNAPGNSYNATGLSPGTTYEVGTRTVDDSDKTNTAWVNDTAATLAADPSAMRVNVMPEYYTFNGTSNIIWGNCHWDPADTIHTGTYNWTFDDGTSATGAVSDTAGWGHARYIPVTHTYTGEGVYYATLTVTADHDGSSDSDTVKINVYNASTLTTEQLEPNFESSNLPENRWL